MLEGSRVVISRVINKVAFIITLMKVRLYSPDF